MTVRTRIAPSPTGDPHVGTAYIALFNMCFARQHGGQFLLRIEDTDRVRSSLESEQAILGALRWLGLEWDEGPDVGGPCGPYRQSERGEIYKAHTDRLLAEGHAFRCFCSSERLDQLRKEQMASGAQPGYDGHCLHLSQEQVQDRLESGHPYVVRMKVPRDGVCVIEDMLRDEPVVIDWHQVDMQVLMKADGMPTYHLANVVDDHLMGITHVIRGEEWISSAPKHLLLYQYFGWQPPVLCHMPLLRNPDKSKLSKRKNPTSINYYRRMGYMPEAMLNYLGRMGWSMPDEREKFSLAEMQAEFDITRVSLGGPVFDIEKLNWLNASWIREELDSEQFMQRVVDWALNREYLGQVVPLVKERIERFSDLMPLAGLFLAGMPEFAPGAFEHPKLSQDDQRRILQFSAWTLDGLRSWNKDAVYGALSGLAAAMGLKIRDFLPPLFVAMSGKASSPPLFDTMAILGPDMTRSRLRHALDALGGVSKKEAKAWEKEFAVLQQAPEA